MILSIQQRLTDVHQRIFDWTSSHRTIFHKEMAEMEGNKSLTGLDSVHRLSRRLLWQVLDRRGQVAKIS